MAVTDRAFLRASLNTWTRRKHYRQQRLRSAQRGGNAKRIEHWRRLVDKAQYWIDRRRSQLHAARPLRLRALANAETLVGVMERGGNNMGTAVEKIIHANGGGGPEPWCGDFVAYCYRLAGSRAVTRAWASVALLGGVAGVRRTSSPLPGDLVRFTFDHVGMYVRDAGAYIETIEGNTGATGAVSDSSTGGDGVYRKRRPKSQVNDYLRVSR